MTDQPESCGVRMADDALARKKNHIGKNVLTSLR